MKTVDDTADSDRNAKLERWFRDHADRVLAYLLHRTDPHTAQDVLQEVFVTAFRKAQVVPEPPIGWLIGTARHTLANTDRSARRRDLLTARLVASGEHVADIRPDSHADHVADAVLGSGDPRVSTALAQLSAADREVLTLSAWYDLTADQAAESLGCSRSAYRVRLHRARHRLADLLRHDVTTPLTAEVSR